MAIEKLRIDNKD